jgi:pyruvate-formate lyase-activating enzyme
MKTRERIRGIGRSPLIALRIMMRGRYDFIYDRMAISQRGMSWAKRTNLARSGLNLFYRKIRPWGMPLHMQFELANQCNLRCPVCPTGNRELDRLPQMMDLSLFRDTMAEVGPYLLTASLWGWGESLLHPQLAGFLREAQKYKITVLLSTNGQNLDQDEVIDAIAEYPPTYLIVAIDGITDETNSRFRIGARLAPVINGMRKLVERKRRLRRSLPILQMRFIEMRHNRHELPQVEAFAASNGFEMLAFRTLSVIASDSGNSVHSQLAEGAVQSGKDPSDGQETDHVCMHPFWFPTLFADGTVVACDQDFNAQKPIGRMSAELKFRGLWTGAEAAAVRRVIRDESESLAFCRNCPERQRNSTDTSYRAIWLDHGRRREFVMEG